MTQRQFFFIFNIRSKGRELKGGRMVASGFNHRSPAQVENRQMITRFKLLALAVLAALARIVSRGHPESLT
jgi:hypothetical protein